jgi:hypothetical protein
MHHLLPQIGTASARGAEGQVTIPIASTTTGDLHGPAQERGARSQALNYRSKFQINVNGNARKNTASAEIPEILRKLRPRAGGGRAARSDNC